MKRATKRSEGYGAVGWNGDDTKDPLSDLHRERRAPGKKNRRRWCRGKAGVEHKPAIVPSGWLSRECAPMPHDPTRWNCWHIVACSECGKHLSMKAPECPNQPPTRSEKAMNATTTTTCNCTNPDQLCDDCTYYAAQDAEK